jgi:hypothetical protein
MVHFDFLAFLYLDIPACLNDPENASMPHNEYLILSLVVKSFVVTATIVLDITLHWYI